MTGAFEEVADIRFVDTHCPICGDGVDARELYPANLQRRDLTPWTFSARRRPDRVHYRVVVCVGCGLARADPVVETAALMSLYEASHFSYAAEVADLTATYGAAFARVMRASGRINRLLEVGCGNGFFLKAALRMGVAEVYGVEASREAAGLADPDVKDKIFASPFTGEMFQHDTFDMVCLFQVLDHLPAPAETLRGCFAVLRPGGVVLLFHHNLNAVSARVLGERSPIVDVEHTFLFTPKTTRNMLETVGFRTVSVRTAVNRHSVGYLVSLLPSGTVASVVSRLVSAMRLGGVSLWLPIGNIVATGVKPS